MKVLKFGLLLLSLVLTSCLGSKVSYSCTMNGLGDGECSFTNTGSFSGSMCGKIVVVKNENEGIREESGLFCSGNVPAKSTTKVSFSVIKVNALCREVFKNWTDVCSFYFIEEG